MVYVSEKPLKREVFVRISELFIAHIANVHTRSHSKQFLDEILTQAEKIMLAKRFAIVVMLYRKQSYSSIMKTLKVSQTTVAKINLELKKGKFDFITSKLQKVRIQKIGKRKGKESNFWVALEVLIQAGMPSMGKGRWKFLDELDHKKELRRNRKI